MDEIGGLEAALAVGIGFFFKLSSIGVLSKVGLNLSTGGEILRISFPSVDTSKSLGVMDGCFIKWEPNSFTESCKMI